MIELLNGRLGPAQREQLAAAMPRIQWEFPDEKSSLHLVAERDSLRVAEVAGAPGLLVRMRRTTLEDAVFGRRSLTSAFLAGHVHVRGLSPLRLREFILLIDPLLDSYREAHRDICRDSLPAAPLVP